MLEIDVTRRQGWTVLAVVGDLDLAGLPTFRTTAHAALTRADRGAIVDLTAVDLIDSTGLGALLGLRRRARGGARDIRLVCPAGRVRDVLTQVDFDQVFRISEDLVHAVEDGVRPPTGVPDD